MLNHFNNASIGSVSTKIQKQVFNPVLFLCPPHGNCKFTKQQGKRGVIFIPVYHFHPITKVWMRSLPSISIVLHIFNRLLLSEIYQTLRINIWLNVNCILIADGVKLSIFQWQTEYEFAPDTILLSQTQHLRKWASYPLYQMLSE